MNRRALLSLLGGLTAAAAGCSSVSDGESTPGERTPQSGATPTAGAEPTGRRPTLGSPSATGSPVADHAASFVSFIEDRDVDVREVGTGEDRRTVTLRYATTETDYEDLGAEVGTVAGGFFREIERGWAVDRLEATIVSPDGTPLATWHARRAWLAEFRANEITGRELSLRILRTLEPAE